jgi:DNA-binding transcriptional ArsR family regulator
MRYPGHPAAGDVTITDVLAALSDPIRICMVRSLTDGKEHPAGEFSLPIARSTISHHAKVLREAGITFTRVDGTHRYISIRPELEERFPGLLDAIMVFADRDLPSPAALSYMSR